MYGRTHNPGRASAAVRALAGAEGPMSDPLGVFDYRPYPKPAKPKKARKRKFKGSKAAKKASRK